MRISDWSSDVCSSDLAANEELRLAKIEAAHDEVRRPAGHILDTDSADFFQRRFAEGADCDRNALKIFRPLLRRHDDFFKGETRGAGRRSEERRVGKEGVSTGRSRGGPYHIKKK